MKSLAVLGFVVALTLMSAAGALAQTPPATQPPPAQPPAAQPPAGQPPAEQPQVPEPRERRPYRGVFGGHEARAGQPGLWLTLTGSGGYDDNVLAGQPGGTDPRAPIAGTFAAGDAQLAYGAARGRFTFDAVGNVQLQYYDSEADWNRFNNGGLAAVSVPLGRRTTMTARQGVRYSPYYQLSVSPTLPDHQSPELRDLPSVEIDNSIAALSNYTYVTELGAVRPVGAGSIGFSYAFRATDFEDPGMESRSQSAGASYSRRASRYTTLRFGYRYERVSRGDSEVGGTTLHNIDLGGGYSRPLSFSRRTTVSFSGGTALSTTEEDRHFRFIGDAAIHHEIGRTWYVRGAYRQGVQVVEIFPEPLFGYSVTTSVDGLLGRRTDLRFDAAYSSGEFDSGRQGDAYASVQGSARLRRALTRSVAAYIEYSYYRYDSEGLLTIPGVVVPDIRRHGVRVGISLWFPLLVSRQVDATR